MELWRSLVTFTRAFPIQCAGARLLTVYLLNPDSDGTSEYQKLASALSPFSWKPKNHRSTISTNKRTVFIDWTSVSAGEDDFLFLLIMITFPQSSCLVMSWERDRGDERSEEDGTEPRVFPHLLIVSQPERVIDPTCTHFLIPTEDWTRIPFQF